MSSIRQSGKINDNTTLIDIGMQDVHGLAAVYLIRGARTCLIDSGTRTEAPRLIKMLTEMDAFPPDLIIATHPHWDHTQGIPRLRQEASRQGKKIEVLASAEALPLLADASFNNVFGGGPYENIQDVTPIVEGDTIDLGGISLRMYEVPGHCRGHLAILDEKSGNLFVGDAIGYKLSDTLLLPTFMPPTWDAEAFISSVSKLRQIPYETLSLAHFGCIYGPEAKSLLDEAMETYNTWWQWYEKHAGRLDDTGYLLRAMREEISPNLPVVRPVSIKMKVLLGLVNAVGAVLGRKTAIMDKLFFGGIVRWLATGYRMHESTL